MQNDTTIFERQCTKCQVKKPAIKFQFRNGKPSGWCLDCKAAYKREKRKKDRALNPLPKKFDDLNNKICPKCKVGKEHANYQLHKGNPVGWCRSCRTEKEKERRRNNGAVEISKSYLVESGKLCMECKKVKSLTSFSASARGLGGVSSYCKPCSNRRFKPCPETGRRATQKYRMNNRERHLASHRIRMFERRHRIKIQSDGTVTDEFLKRIYNTETCTYCKNYTDPEKRTADHKTPLIRGGAHSASNIEMACFSCNSSKSKRTSEEFIKWREE